MWYTVKKYENFPGKAKFPMGIEYFYHGVLLGLFGNMDGWKVKSNAESGDSCSDISVEVEDQETGIVIELECAENAAFDNAYKEALKQIYDNSYEEALADNDVTAVYRYGTACYKNGVKRFQVRINKWEWRINTKNESFDY